MNMEIKLYNSLSRTIEPFIPLNENLVKIYSCGPTVYNYAHIGNMRAFLFADLLQRAIRTVGNYQVQWVMNITDIDDKTIRDSRIGSDLWLSEMGVQTQNPIENLKKFTKFFTDKFFEDIQSLGIDLSHFYSNPRATEFIPQMQDLINRIYNNGIAYINDGSVYFNVSKWSAADKYGKLKNIDWDNFKSGSRIDQDNYEREDASDFVLWKAQKEGEPHWEFILDGQSLPGRPGWHLECSTMEYEILGLPFDIHTGGVDLQFPHHEDEIAQSKAGYGIEPNPFWCHNEFLEVEGKKMSKSLGNFYTLRELISAGIDPLDIRLAMFSAHYRTKFNFSFDGTNSVRKARTKVQEYIYELFTTSETPEITSIPEGDSLLINVFNELSNDLHTPKALARIFEFFNKFAADKLSNDLKQQVLSDLKKINDVFNVWRFEPRPEEIVDIPKDIIELAELRFKAKKEKNYQLADELRNKITLQGYSIIDKKDGYEIVPN